MEIIQGTPTHSICDNGDMDKQTEDHSETPISSMLLNDDKVEHKKIEDMGAASEKNLEKTRENNRFNLRPRKKTSYFYNYKDDFLMDNEMDKHIGNRHHYIDLPHKRNKYQINLEEDSDYEAHRGKRIRGRKMEKKHLGSNYRKQKKEPKPIHPLDLLIPNYLHKLNITEENTSSPGSSTKSSDMPFDSYELHKTNSVQDIEVTKIANNMEAVLISPPWNYDQEHPAYPPFTFKDFKKLKLGKKLIRDGMVFIWVEKQSMLDIILYFEKMGFYYVENLAWIKLDRARAQEVDTFKYSEEGSLDISGAYARTSYLYFNKSKATLLLLRKKNEKSKLELRHQRTCDVVFDFYDPEKDPFYKPKEYVYSMIETLLPKANYKPKYPPHEIEVGFSDNEQLPFDDLNDTGGKLENTLISRGKVNSKIKLKMLELWGDSIPRKGWIKIYDTTKDAVIPITPTFSQENNNSEE